MGLVEQVASWFDSLGVEFFQCSNCGRRFEETHSSCPECGGEITGDAPPDTMAAYWDGM